MGSYCVCVAAAALRIALLVAASFNVNNVNSRELVATLKTMLVQPNKNTLTLGAELNALYSTVQSCTTETVKPKYMSLVWRQCVHVLRC